MGKVLQTCEYVYADSIGIIPYNVYQIDVKKERPIIDPEGNPIPLFDRNGEPVVDDTGTTVYQTEKYTEKENRYAVTVKIAFSLQDTNKNHVSFVVRTVTLERGLLTPPTPRQASKMYMANIDDVHGCIANAKKEYSGYIYKTNAGV